MSLATLCLGVAMVGGANDAPAQNPAVSPRAPAQAPNLGLLRETWQAYVTRFVEPDGRVVDPRAGGISTSEGQAYAMLRAVWIDDRPVFDRAWRWADQYLNRGVRQDALWAWRWEPGPAGGKVSDRAFASDADQDAALALLMAAERWGEVRYRDQARRVLADLWKAGTLVVGKQRFLLAGDSSCDGSRCRLNPSYLAPYAYRVFARHDPKHRWSQLVDSSYAVLDADIALTQTRLPTDWVLLRKPSGRLRSGGAKDDLYSYDALRVPWRVELDARLYREPRALRLLERSLAWIVTEWRRSGRIPARIDGSGVPQAEYESLEMLAAALPALRRVAPDVAAAVRRRLDAALQQGAWGERDSYYMQNWAWFGIAVDEGYLDPIAAVK